MQILGAEQSRRKDQEEGPRFEGEQFQQGSETRALSVESAGVSGGPAGVGSDQVSVWRRPLVVMPRQVTDWKEEGLRDPWGAQVIGDLWKGE